MVPLLSNGETVILFLKMQLQQKVAPSLPEKGKSGSNTLSINRLAGASPSACKSGITAIYPGPSLKSMANRRVRRLLHT